MRSIRGAVVSFTLVFVAVGWLAGCQSTGGREMAATTQEQPMTCQACYDQAQLVRNNNVKGVSYRVIKKHMCKDCKTEVVLYAKDGKPMIMCSKCAPEGMCCDKCRPPKNKP